MKKTLYLLALLCALSLPAFAQNPSTRIIVRTATPAGVRGDEFVLSLSGVHYVCGSATCASNGTGWVAQGGVTGSGTSGKFAKFTGSGSVGDSIVSESGSTITVNGSINLSGASRELLMGGEARVGFTLNKGVRFYDENTLTSLTFDQSAFNADREYDLPNASGELVLDTAAQTLTNKTLTTPTVGSFANANHDHTNPAGGGTLSAAVIASGQLAAARGGFGADVSGSSGVPLFAAGVPTFTSTSGTGNFARVTSPIFVTPTLGSAAATDLTIARGSVSSGSGLSLTSTWTGGGTFPGSFFLNVTDSSSAAASLLADLQVGSVSKFSVRKDGLVTAGSYFANAAVRLIGLSGNDVYLGGVDNNGGLVIIRNSGTDRWQLSNNGGHLLPSTDNVYTHGDPTHRPSEAWGVKHCYAANVCDFYGSGSPESVVTASVGSTYRRTDGGAATSFYVKESGSATNTGWAAK